MSLFTSLLGFSLESQSVGGRIRGLCDGPCSSVQISVRDKDRQAHTEKIDDEIHPSLFKL